MDPLSIAGAAVGFLVPVFKSMAERGLTKVGEVLGDASEGAVGGLYARIKHKLAGDSYGEQLLAGVEAKPESDARRGNLETALAELIESDPEFGQQLADLIAEAEAGGAASVQAINSGITAGGDVNQTAGGDAVGRDKVTHGPPQSAA